uniref:WW domain-containing protein n=1 Tax=Tetraselmis sp. GSL018 TaxID=582737 RepID=A0A061SA11_9CHLO|eukprot:CAMPEP_0177598422 /NCGR_PEP_ID=MMETSP0419_2-20121207/12341_1 /TAXON_ID=582737 /ORGANISM="Tetraselmis sp., Strain GSL018" /LENGTH=188 /DNA_ID=CAMNT_0019090867 /DNA_START=350 /DNA_END=916 /DNA_ORIENTATION=-
MSGGGKQYDYSGYGGGGGVTISDPNYGGTDLASFGNPRDSPSYRNAASSQPIPVSGYDVFSYAPDHPSSNYPSMTAAVADYGPQAGYQGGYQGGMQPAGSGPQLQDYGPPPPAQDPHAAQMGDGWGGGWQPAAAQPPQAYPAAWEQPQGPPGPGGGDSWQVCYTPEGHQYWHNTATGLTQWEPPAGVA